MTNKMYFLICTFFLLNASMAQLTRSVVKFKNKDGTPHTIASPSTYLSQRAIDRRIKYSISIDSTDLPVTPSYISQVRTTPNVTLLNVSRWLNAVTIQTSDVNAITAINTLPFVFSTNSVAAKENNTGKITGKYDEELYQRQPYNSGRTEQLSGDYYNYGSGSLIEIHLHNGEFLHNIGLRGQGMQIAMLDNGFNNYTTLKSFDSMNTNGQVLGTWDFVAREQNVANDGSHGMSCLSTIAANIPGQFIGKAPKASFWLYQTEDNASEYPIEEFNWACGAEKADSAGTDVISSSLGYGYGFDGGLPDYPYSTLDGNTTMAAKAADLAAKKGMMVFVAAGNAGNLPWRNIISPADGDSVIAVGAVTSTGIVGSFSSYGPSGDGQIKPDLASVGVAAMIQSTSNTIITGNGTSYACPNLAGLGTILWQGFPEFNNMKVLDALKKSANKYNNPDNRTGYGIPDLKLAFAKLLADYSGASGNISNCTAVINWSSKDLQIMKYEIEQKATGDTGYRKIGSVAAQQGLVLSNRNYQYSISLSGISQGTIYYRIRQIIDTAISSYYAVYLDSIQLTVPDVCSVTGKTGVIVQPNPVVEIA
ncbi:MAG: S8 family serine peptidase [Chitinophagaceae bacterium]|nr:S8 family serine peptidase [Chitinophagaceae bacterium]